MVCANCIIGPIVYEGTLDAQQYINEILNPFFVNLAHAEDLVILCKTPHTAKENI
jgi:hypothetical protein